MQIIVSHVNTDLDALASMFAAKKLYPNASVVISDKQNMQVKQFLTIYRETLDLVEEKSVDWSNVTELILVDVASLARIGDDIDQLPKDNMTVTVYDHHPVQQGDVDKDFGLIEPTGAAVTLLIEQIREQSIAITSFEATLFGLGIYTDTGAFTHHTTTARDFQAAGYLMEQGMNLEIVQRFSEEVLGPEQQDILNHLFQRMATYEIEGLHIVVSAWDHGKFQQGLSTIAQKLLELTEADAVLTVVGMKKRIFIVGRASSERITLLPLLKKWKGGGHEQAGSASVKHGDLETVLNEVKDGLEWMLKPAITAQDMMTSPVKTITPNTSIEEAGHFMYRYGHSGFPVVEAGELVGMVTRRDLEKANHHGLGHAPVKAYMTTDVITIKPETTEEEIQQITIERDIGRLPVLQDGALVGIVSRTNIIEMLHHQKLKEALLSNETASQENLQTAIREQLPEEVYNLLQAISETATSFHGSVYLIGGIVRDIFLRKENDDIDIVVEGDGVSFAKCLQKEYGGNVVSHHSFGTATWMHPNGLEIDVTSARLEYYDRPAALPDVELSTLKEDLYRRDFTINAMAICLDRNRFGELVDPFRGKQDLEEKKITILHNLSFVEDPTRIFRGVRFETRFDFYMDKQTEQLALHSIDRVKDLSTNRIVNEMERLFGENNPVRAMNRLFALQFWQQFGVKEMHAERSSQQAKRLFTLYVTSESLQRPSWFLYFCMPFYIEGNIGSAKRFALTKKDSKLLREIICLKDIPKNEPMETEGELHHTLRNFSEEAILFFVIQAAFSDEKLVMNYLFDRRQLPKFLTGKDLIEYGVKPGTVFSDILFDFDVSVLNGEVTSQAEAEAWLKRRISHLE